VKEVAMEKKIAVPPSRVESTVAISVPGTEAQLITRSQRPPPVAFRTASSTSTALVASTRRLASDTPSSASAESAFSETSSASS
jgi:hypothetical protein